MKTSRGSGFLTPRKLSMFRPCVTSCQRTLKWEFQQALPRKTKAGLPLFAARFQIPHYDTAVVLAGGCIPPEPFESQRCVIDRQPPSGSKNST